MDQRNFLLEKIQNPKDSRTYNLIDKLPSYHLNILIKFVEREERIKLRLKKYNTEKRILIKEKLCNDSEFLKETASYLYSHFSGYGSDDEDLLQEWDGICPYRTEKKFGYESCDYCYRVHHALSTEPKCSCNLHKDMKSIY